MERASCFSCSLLLSVGLVAILGVMEEHRCMRFVRLPFDMLTLYPPLQYVLLRHSFIWCSNRAL